MRVVDSPPNLSLDDLKNPVFEGVDARVLELFLRRGTVRLFRPGEVVLAEDEEAKSFFILHRGSLRIYYRSPDDREVVVKLFRAPAVFGEMECLNGIPYLESVNALEKAVVLDVPRSVFLEALSASHALTRNLLVDVSARLCISAQVERSLAFHPVETRLANLFSTYLDFYGLPVHDGIKIRIPLTQDDLANALGVARRSITRTLQRWSAERIVIKQSQHYVVCNLTELARYSDPTLLRMGYRLGAPLTRTKRR